MGSGVFGVVPVKDLGSTKSRLAPILDPCARAGLTLYMMRRVVRAALRAGVEEVVVISPDNIVLDYAAEVGASVHRQKSDGLNAALYEGRDIAFEREARSMLVLPSDLPLVEAEDIEGLLESHESVGRDRSLSITPDGAGAGTNALLLSPPDAIPFSFGIGSFEAHLASASESTVEARIFENTQLAFDLDTGQDLANIAPDDVYRWTRNGIPSSTIKGACGR